MVRSKSKATIHVADGSGGMMKVEDRRFESAPWPISFEVPKEGGQADDWLRYLNAECNRRGWTAGGIGQIERPENSGSLTINTGLGQAQLAIRWERRRGGPLKVSARSVGAPEFPTLEAQTFLDAVIEQCRSRVTEKLYRRGTLHYDGLAWRGELWLDNDHRLTAPSRQDETALTGPRIVHLDVMLDCIGGLDAPTALRERLGEVSAFLSVVMGQTIRLPPSGRAWTWQTGSDDCTVRQLGYMEAANPTKMPQRGEIQAVPLRPLHALPRGLDGSTNQQILRDDVVDLWTSFQALLPERRRQFLQAAAKWQEAIAQFSDRETLSFALMVVACETLKPPDTDRGANVYDVIRTLLGKDTSDRLRRDGGEYAAQVVRSVHLHTGEFLGDELLRTRFNSSYQDPSFDEAYCEMWKVTQAAIIEWLVRRGAVTVLTVSPQKKSKTLRRRIVENPWTAVAVMLGAGAILGWVLRSVA